MCVRSPGRVIQDCWYEFGFSSFSNSLVRVLAHRYKDAELIQPHTLPRMWGWGRRRGLGWGEPSDAPFCYKGPTSQNSSDRDHSSQRNARNPSHWPLITGDIFLKLDSFVFKQVRRAFSNAGGFWIQGRRFGCWV